MDDDSSTPSLVDSSDDEDANSLDQDDCVSPLNILDHPDLVPSGPGRLVPAVTSVGHPDGVLVADQEETCNTTMACPVLHMGKNARNFREQTIAARRAQRRACIALCRSHFRLPKLPSGPKYNDSMPSLTGEDEDDSTVDDDSKMLSLVDPSRDEASDDEAFTADDQDDWNSAINVMNQDDWTPAIADQDDWVPVIADQDDWVPAIADQDDWVPAIADQDDWVPAIADQDV